MNVNFNNFKGVSQNKMNEFNNLNIFNQKQNIMKKSFLFLAVAATFAACTQNDAINDAISEQEIKFDQVLNKTTKAEITDKAALASEGGFAVFGYKSTSSDAVFNGVKVYSENSGNNWKYDQIRYWDKNATYRFYAIAPYQPTNGEYSIDKTTGVFTITGVKSGLAKDSDDFIIDRDGVSNVEGATANNNQAVSFDFHHIMAKVKVVVKKGVAYNEAINITKLTMSGYNPNVGNFTQKKFDTTWGALDVSEWNIATTGTNGSVELIGGNATDKSIEFEETAEGAAAPSSEVQDIYIMVPQEIEAKTLKFTIDYTLTYSDGTTEVFTDQSATIEDVQIWGTDSHTTYTLTIGGSAKPIEFNVTSVCNFCVDGNNNGNEGDVTIKQ